MNIGLSTSVIQRGETGVAQYVFALLRGLLARNDGDKFTIFVLKEDLALFDFARGHCRIVEVPEKFRPPIRDILWHQTVLPKLVRRHRLDVLHVPSYRRMLWPRPCTLVATIHDLAPFRVPRKYDWKRMLYGKVVARRLAHRQDRIIAVSQNTANDIRNFFRVPAERLRTIYNGLDHGRFFPGTRSHATEFVALRYDLKQPFFLYIARLEHPGKNHVRLIEAFNRFKSETKSNWQLVLGGSDWHGADVIHALIRQSPYRNAIRCVGFVADSELPAFYRAAEAFVYPSLYEGFGFPPLEAMACGCPALCSWRGSLGEVAGEAATLDPENIPDLAQQLKRLATDQEFREHLRATGLERAQTFDWQRTAAETAKLYALAHGKVAWTVAVPTPAHASPAGASAPAVIH
jgi:glycosyltransferase involved in cell wall biosynthesis